MAKKYFSSEEAAQQLGMSIDELNRLRESGELRGFADRGTFKFKADDIEELARTRQTDSSPDVPIMEPGSASVLSADDDVLGDQATIIRKDEDDSVLGDIDIGGSSSDSDVRLILDDSLTGGDDGSDPDVGLFDSDSDVRLVGADSSPALAGASSDSDVKLIGDAAGNESDSDVRIATDAPGGGTDSSMLLGDTSSITLADESSGIALAEESSSVFSDDEDESALILDGGSDIALASDSGISLEAPVDSGISLEFDEGSDITIDTGGSGPIGLADDSGLALDDDVGQTIPLMDAVDARGDKTGDTEFDVPALGASDESDFDLGTQEDGGSGDTSVILFDDEDEDDLVETVGAEEGSDFDMSGGDFDDDDFGDDFEVTADVMDDDDLGVFDADDDDFDDGFETGQSHAEFVAPIAGARTAAAGTDADWGVFTFVGLLASTAVLSVTALVVFDLIVSIRTPSESSLSQPIVKMVGDMMN